jgi:outer membrane protein OmpA-like peptidoglycan-associated protein
LTSFFVFGQKANKTFQDSIFKIGDIIKGPEVGFPTCCWGCPDGIALSTKDTLDKIGKFILKYPSLTFQIDTHTDQRGDALKNKKLSQDRANSIRQYLIHTFPIDSTKLIAKGFGASAPIFTDKDIQKVKTKEEKENLHAQNRRTQLRVIGQN